MKSYKQIIQEVISQGFLFVERPEFEKFNGQKIAFHNGEQTFHFIGADYNFKEGKILRLKRNKKDKTSIEVLELE
jgi:hypothetical protein